MLGIRDAEHAEDRPEAANHLITAVACPVPERKPGSPSLSGDLTIRLRDGSRARAIFGASEIREAYNCNYELNPVYREPLERAGLAFVGEGDRGEVRVFELPGHPFYVGTLFQPQRSSRPDRPHPLITAFLHATK